MTLLANCLDLLAAPVVHERVTQSCTHRPWPLPDGSWTMAQTWTDLLFAHWSVEPELLRRVVPAQLPLDTFDGRAYVGVTPFGVRNLRLRPTPPVPFLSAFAEINVRTYVVLDGKPGIYFFSLDAASALAVAPARADFRARYRPTSDVFSAPGGSLEHWLSERYCLYTFDEQRHVLRGDIHHPPWRLQHAEADLDVNTMTAEIAVDLHAAPLLHYARRQDVVFWTLKPAS